MRKFIFIAFIGIIALAGLLVFVNRLNKMSTMEAKQASIKVTNKIESTYSGFNAYVDSSEQAKREYGYTNRMLLRANMMKDQAYEELTTKNLATEKENRYLKNEIKSLTDSLRSYQRVRYQSN